MKSESGLTLIEILIVVIILGILAGLAIPRLAGRTQEARIQAARADIEGGLGVALDLFEMDAGRYPSRLEDLITKPSNVKKWKGPYLKKNLLKTDPWGESYQYRFPGIHNPGSYDLSSGGPDAILETEDDVNNWEQ